MRPADSHLTPREMDLLLFGPADPRDGNVGSASAREAQQHLSGCAVCQSVAEKYRKADEILRALRSGNEGSSGQDQGPAGSSKEASQGAKNAGKIDGKFAAREAGRLDPDCLAEEIWLSLAAGLLTDEEAAGHVAHAASCKRCSALLKEAMEDLAYDMTAEEQKALTQLPTASPEWQRQMAMKLVAQQREQKDPQPDPKPPFRWWPKLAWATALPAVAIIAVALAWLVWVKTREPDVNVLLAQAYTEQRTIELRMPGAKYSRLRVERGAGRDLPPEFYRAKGIIEGQWAKHPEDPTWLQARARAHILEWDYDKAIDELDRALDLKRDDPGLLLDKATALAQKAEKAEKTDQSDLSEALEDLENISQKNPHDLVALFNRAIILEKMHSPGPAIDAWEHYLTLDPSSGWAEEARRRLRELRKQSTVHQEKLDAPLLDPHALIKEINPDDESTWEAVDLRIEDYLDRAIDTWLPLAYRERPPDRETLQALQLLALISRRHHGDQWLTDMLKNRPSQNWSQALAALGEAVVNNRKGDIEGERVAASRAAKLFALAGSSAGKARADAELEYVFHRTSDAKNCLRTAAELAREIRVNHYAWLDSYLLMEQAVGYALTSQSGRTQQVLAAAVQKTEADRYGTLHLRAVGMEASFKMTEGDIVEGWSRDMRGLAQYWNGVFPPLRGYQFYADLAIAAEDQKYWHLAYVLRKEAAEINALTGDHAREFIAYFAVAQAARMAGLNREADDALQKTSAELKLLPDSDATRTYWTYNQLEQAKLDGQAQHPARGLALLDEIEARVKQSHSSPLLMDFHSTEGDLRLMLNQVKQAKDAFQVALEAAKADLATLKDPHDRLAWQKRTESLCRTFVELLLNEGNSQEALAFLEAHRGAVFPDVEQTLSDIAGAPHSLVAFEGGAAMQPIGQPVVVYAIFPRQLAILVYNHGEINGKLVPVPAMQLERTVQRFYTQCSDSSSDLKELQKNSKQLYDWLIEPIEPFVKASKALSIEPDGILKQVPFRALLNPEQQYLGDIYHVHLIPGIAYLRHIRNPGVITRQTKGLFAGVSASAAAEHGLPAIPSAEKEAANLGAKFFHAHIFKGQDAEVSVIERELPEAEVFHFAGHVLKTQDGVTLLVSSAVANEPGYLDSARLRQLKLKGLQLVVLSGCSTGVELDRSRPQLDQMVEIFLEKGVPQVVASLWNVDTLATADTMESFYDQMVSGKTVANSLQASTRLVRSNAETAHPYYWAGFEIFGGSH